MGRFTETALSVKLAVLLTLTVACAPAEIAKVSADGTPGQDCRQPSQRTACDGVGVDPRRPIDNNKPSDSAINEFVDREISVNTSTGPATATKSATETGTGSGTDSGTDSATDTATETGEVPEGPGDVFQDPIEIIDDPIADPRGDDDDDARVDPGDGTAPIEDIYPTDPDQGDQGDKGDRTGTGTSIALPLPPPPPPPPATIINLRRYVQIAPTSYYRNADNQRTYLTSIGNVQGSGTLRVTENTRHGIVSVAYGASSSQAVYVTYVADHDLGPADHGMNDTFTFELANGTAAVTATVTFVVFPVTPAPTAIYLFDGPTLDFGDVPLGSLGVKTVKLVNLGTKSLAISAYAGSATCASIGYPYRLPTKPEDQATADNYLTNRVWADNLDEVAGTCGHSLAPDSDCTFKVVFAPTNEGQYAGCSLNLRGTSGSVTSAVSTAMNLVGTGVALFRDDESGDLPQFEANMAPEGESWNSIASFRDSANGPDGSTFLLMVTHPTARVFKISRDGSRTASAVITQFNQTVSGLAVDQNGKVLVVGTRNGQFGDYTFANDRYAVLRLKANLTIDNTFGVNGFVTTHVAGNDGASAVAVDDTGRILVAGITNNLDEALATGSIATANTVAVVRYLSNGTVDSTFGTNGRARLFGSPSERQISFYAAAIEPRADGGFEIIGTQSDDRRRLPQQHPYLAFIGSCSADGTVDQGFGDSSRGYLLLEQMGVLDASTRQEDGGLLIGGQWFDGTNVSFGVARVTTRGAIDLTFGGTSEAGILSLGELGLGGRVNTIALSSDNYILVGGSLKLGATSQRFGAVVRAAADGVLDDAFGTHGVVVHTAAGHNFSTDIMQLSTNQETSGYRAVSILGDVFRLADPAP